MSRSRISLMLLLPLLLLSMALRQVPLVNSKSLTFEKKDGVEYIHMNYPGWIHDVIAETQPNLILFGY